MRLRYLLGEAMTESVERIVFPPKPLKFSYDEESDVLTIERIRYSGELFRAFGFAPEGERFEIVERKDGIVTLRSLPKEKP